MAFIQRKDVSAGEMIFDFPAKRGFGGHEWLVKNMTDGAILVSFEADAPDDESILIPANTAEIVSMRKGMGMFRADKVIVKPQSNAKTGSVEVRCLRW